MGLVCLNLSIKIFESNYSGVELIYKYSMHNYKSSEIIRMEQKIVETMEFKIDRREELIVDRVIL